MLGGVILPRERRKYVGRGGWKAFVAPSWFFPGTPGLVVPFFRGFPNTAYTAVWCVCSLGVPVYLALGERGRCAM